MFETSIFAIHPTTGKAAGALALAGFLIASAPAVAEFDATPFIAHDAESQEQIDYGPWAEFLAKHVRADEDGLNRVDYGAVTEPERARLEAFLADLQAVDVAALSRDEQFAYWINLYNLATVQVVLEHHPVASIRDIALPPAGDGGGPWDAPRLEVLGHKLSLNDVEHRILRPLWGDARIHFAVNCASVGCPNLATEPFLASRLDAMLDAAAADFVNHERAIRFEGEGLVLSSLFDWYGGDFGDDLAEILEHLAEFAHPALAEKLEDFEGLPTYSYDWDVNGF